MSEIHSTVYTSDSEVLDNGWLTLVEDGLVVVCVCFTQQELEDHFCSSVPFHTLQWGDNKAYSTNVM